MVKDFLVATVKWV